MPELPEVETIRRQLNEKLKNQVIRSVQILKIGRETPHGQAFAKAVTGKKINLIDRRAKLLIWRFTDGSSVTIHLKLTGRVILVDNKFKPGKHDRMIFEIGPHRLVWSDMRQFGRTNFLTADALEKKLSEYGPEPLEIKPEQLAALFINPKTRNVKSALLNQEVLAGVGNIYADEALFRAKIRPTRKLGSLTASDRLSLAKAVQEVLKLAIKLKGTSSQDYLDAYGQEGKFEKVLNVYQRKGLPCKVCGTPIIRTVVAQRGTHYCPKCQK
jgi:formamidopyrimidine-DNA glycosylase